MSICQSLNKVVPQGAKGITDRLMPVFRRHRWNKENECTRCYKTRNPKAKVRRG